MHSTSRLAPDCSIRRAYRACGALVCAFAVFLAGCHHNQYSSGYGDLWVSLTDEPGDFASYIVNVDSIELTRNDGAVVTALATVETVDFTKLSSIAEMWGVGTVATGTYVKATIALDYTNAVITVMVNGQPQQAHVVDKTGAAVTTKTIIVNLDPNVAYQPTLVPTYATTGAERLALDLDLAASTVGIDYATSPATVYVDPYMTAALAPADAKPLRIRGPLINSSVGLGTYTVYVRPFHDEENSLGSLTMFANANTIFDVNGTISTGTAGITQLSQSSAGATVTAAYTTFEPTATPTAVAGKFNVLYMIGGSTLEDIYTQGIEGDVIARTGNTLTVLGSTLQLNDGLSNYYVTPATVTLGPSTIVTADDSTQTGFDYNSVAVGQHIIARGEATISGTASNILTFDSTGNSATNTGSVRLIPTQLYGSYTGPSASGLVMNLSTINDWPVSDYDFAGNGTSAATDPTAAAFVVNTGAIAEPATAAGGPLFVDGLFAAYGAAPPDFTARSVNNEASVQTAGSAAAPFIPTGCGQANPDCVSASMQVHWSGTGTTMPFTGLSAAGMSVNLANTSITSAVIRIGPESFALSSLPASPTIVPIAPPTPITTNAGVAGSIDVTLPPLYLPAYSYGDPESTTAGVYVASAFATFAADFMTAVAATPAIAFDARGTYDRATNTFYAVSVNVLL